MVDKNVVLSRVDYLREYLKFLNGVKQKSSDEYLGNPYIYGSAERFLHLAIESTIDIGNHIIAGQMFRKPEDNRDIFRILNEEGVLDKELSGKLCGMAGFRNILVHGYTKLNREMVYSILQNNLIELEKFITIIVHYI